MNNDVDQMDLKVVYKRSLLKKDNLTVGKEYSVEDMELSDEYDVAGVAIPPSASFTIKDDKGDYTKLSLCHVDVFLDGEPLF